MAAPSPQTFPYDYLFKVLIIGDASVGKVRKEGERLDEMNIFGKSGGRCGDELGSLFVAMIFE